METFKVLTLLFVAVLMASASPRIRSGRDPKEPDVDTRRNFVSCFQTIPCGWALYTTERRQPFRRISTYTRNRLCDCDQDSHCVLTDNWQDRRAYVFHCRERDSSSHMFPFPDRK